MADQPAPPSPPAAPLYDTATGKKVPFATPEDAQAAIQAGKAAAIPTNRVPVQLADGTPGTVPGSEVGQVLQQGGRLQSAQEVRAAMLERKYGWGGGIQPTTVRGMRNMLAMSGAAAFRGATLGLSDKVIVEAERLLHGQRGADIARQTLSELKEAHPTLTTVNELGGVAAASLAGTPGAGALRGLPAALVGETGALVERGIAGLVGSEGAGLGAQVVQKAISLGARGAVEGALYNAGDTYSEAILGDHQLTAEKVYSALGMGALVGGVSGVGAGALGALGKRGLTAIADRVAPALRDAAGEQAVKALGPTRGMAAEIERRAGGAAEMGNTLLEYGVIGRDASLLKTLGTAPEEILTKATAAKELVGQKIGAIIHDSPAYVRGIEVLRPFNDVIKKLEGQALHESILGSLVEARSSFGKQLGILDAFGNVIPSELKRQVPIADFVAQRRALDDIAFKESKALDPRLRVAFLREIRSGLSEVEMSAIERAATEHQKGPRASEIKALYRQYQHLALAERAAERLSAGEVASGGGLGIKDYLAMAGSMASGHPIAGPAVGLASKYVRERGNMLAALALDKLASLGSLRKLGQDSSSEMAGAVSGFFTRPTRAVGAHARTRGEAEESIAKRYQAAVNHVVALSNDPTVPQRVEHATRGMASHAPKTATEVSSVVARAINLLSNRIPAAPAHGPLTSMRAPRVPERDMASFLRLYEGVVDHGSVLQDMKRGRVTREGVEALKTTSPKLYAELQAQVLAKLTDELSRGSVPYDKRLRLAILFDAPADPSLRPEMIKALQEKPQGEKPDSAPGADRPKRPLKGIGKFEKTQTQSIEEGRA